MPGYILDRQFGDRQFGGNSGTDGTFPLSGEMTAEISKRLRHTRVLENVPSVPGFLPSPA